MINILFICNEFPPVRHGGIGIFVKTMANALRNQGARVSILGYNPDIRQDQVQQMDGISVYWLRRRKTWIPNTIVQHVYDRFHLTRRMRLLERELRPDLVESFDWSGPLLWKPKFAKLIVRMHGANSVHAYSDKKRISKLLFFFEKLQLLLADNLCAVSHHIGKSTSACFNIKREYKVIHNPVDCDRFSPMPSIKKDQNLLLYVGRIHPKKGLTELMHVFNLVHAIAPHINLMVVGEGLAEYIQTLKDILTESAYKNVSFREASAHENLPDIYNQSTVTVMPSKVEAFGLTIIESMACGIAPIISNRTSGNELVIDGESGWLVDVQRYHEFCKKILYVFDNEQERLKLGQNARKRAISLFSLNMVAEENMNFYKRLIK